MPKSSSEPSGTSSSDTALPDLFDYPGGDLVAQGLSDLAAGRHSEAAILILVAAPRLRRLGFRINPPPDPPAIPEHALFEAVESRRGRGAHAAYNALLARMASFADAYGRAAKE